MKTPYEVAKEEHAKWNADQTVIGNNTRILEYDQFTDLKANDVKTAWCSSFMNYCINISRLSGWLGPREDKSPAAISWNKWGEETKTPKEGDLVILKRGILSWQAHITFFVSSDALTVTCLGGNQGNRVKISKFLKARVLSYRRATGY
jgi:uncharacterized protein (TIGR02594 family)